MIGIRNSFTRKRPGVCVRIPPKLLSSAKERYTVRPLEHTCDNRTVIQFYGALLAVTNDPPLHGRYVAFERIAFGSIKHSGDPCSQCGARGLYAGSAA